MTKLLTNTFVFLSIAWLGHADSFEMEVIPHTNLQERLSLATPTHKVHHKVQTENITDPPYIDVLGGKAQSPFKDYPEYELRLVDYYLRQGRYYVTHPEKQTDLVPGFPGLDAGIYGHHAKFNKNGMASPMRDEMDQGHVHQNVGDNRDYGVFLNDEKTALLVYDSTACRPTQFLNEGDVDYDDYRMSTARKAKVVGDTVFAWEKHGWDTDKPYVHGHYRTGSGAVFAYRVEDHEVLEGFDYRENILRQMFWFKEGFDQLRYKHGESKDAVATTESGLNFLTSTLTNDQVRIWSVGGELECRVEGATLNLSKANKGSAACISWWQGPAENAQDVRAEMIAQADEMIAAAGKLPEATRRSKTERWPLRMSGAGDLETDAKGHPYVIDTLPLPVRNPYKAPMLLTGIDFDPEGNAYVCTLFGDIWKVSGIDQDLKNVTWKRMIAGLNSPFGVLYDDGVLYVGDKAELIALHDVNGDEEYDYVQRVNQAFEGFGRNVHSGLVRDREGAFWYITGQGLAKLQDDEYEVVSPPLRTAFSLAITHDDKIWAAPQEGDGTPASAIYEYEEGDDLYRPQFRGNAVEAKKMAEKIDPALVYLPRGVDNSTGGGMPVRSDRFGPLGDKMLNLSYGAASVQAVLRSDPKPGKRRQGAVFNLPGHYFSGVNHGAVNPKDGQVYIVGTDGWGTYAVADGCLQRLRYTGKPVYYPVAFETHKNGVVLDFDEALDAESAGEVKNYFAQQWNYLYANAYGSPEYSVRDPGSQGHDRLNLRSVHVLNGGKRIFLEMPDWQPAMTTHLYGKLNGGDGSDFELNLFLTALELEPDFTDFPQYAKAEADKPASLTLPYTFTQSRAPYISPKDRREARKVTIKGDDALRFHMDEPLGTIQAGERILFRLENIGVGAAMGHNALVTRKEDTVAIGEASDATITDPKAFQHGYVPLYVPEVKKKILAYSTLVQPGEKTEFLWRPESAGTYTVVCTFPGHWRIMQFDVEVTNAADTAPEQETSP